MQSLGKGSLAPRSGVRGRKEPEQHGVGTSGKSSLYTVPRVSGAGADGGWECKVRGGSFLGKGMPTGRALLDGKMGHKGKHWINSLKASHQAGDTGTGEEASALFSRGSHSRDRGRKQANQMNE